MKQETWRKLMLLTSSVAVGFCIDVKYNILNDLRTYGPLLPTLLKIKYRMLRGDTIADLFEQVVDRLPVHHIGIEYLQYQWTYRELDQAMNQVAHYALSIGLRPGQHVALLMTNCPEYIIVWMGLAKVGIVTAFINTHIKQKPLIHSIKVSDASLVIIGRDMQDQARHIQSQLPECQIVILAEQQYYQQHEKPACFPLINDILRKLPTERPSREYRRDILPTSLALMIYTSGTTGLPKAARIEHGVMVTRSEMVAAISSASAQDKIYCCMPLYHAAGGTLGPGLMMLQGSTLVIAKSFSATKFWKDVRHHKCTIIQYIGELCRYLLAVPEAPDLDAKNHVRLAIGNGLRPEIWPEFQARFGIASVLEFYGSTEGNAGLMNYCTCPSEQGHLGRTGRVIETILGLYLVEYDIEKEDHVRDANGFLVECAPNRVGELITNAREHEAGRNYSGYYGDENATKAKILRNVFVKGDAYVRTGDLLRRDAAGRWFFVDRIGDTFRWKGENVSTSEVAQALSLCPEVEEVNVYGVQVPGTEGRACMAAMRFNPDTLDMAAFATHVETNLPLYARPLFLRLVKKMTITGTFKHQKQLYRKQGMNPSEVGSDRLWYYNQKQHTYLPLTLANYSTFLQSRL